MVAVTLPDGSVLDLEDGVTVEEVAYEIGPGLGAATVAGVVDGELMDRHAPLETDCELEIVTEDSEEYLRVLRHSAAHVFAQALQRRYPEATLTIGPPTDEGFYYDVTGVDLDEDDLDAIEEEMADIVAADYDIERVERSREEAFEIYGDNEYKREILETEAAGEEEVSFYVQDDWQDLCRGPHVDSTGEVGAFELLSVSAAYWRGDEDNETLTRVHGTELWKQSGHYENYRDDMFLLDVNDEEYGLKPMNCPGHASIFEQGSWSYRDLPVRYAEDGKVYRKEQRGELSGLSRVWAFTIDDGHLFCRPGDIEREVDNVMTAINEVLGTFDLDYNVALATRPEKSVGSDEIWERAESQLESVLESSDLDYDVEPGDGAFYGPKIDFGFEDALGREWDGPTVQLDFNMPERFDLSYIGEDNDEHRPVMIHRALYGSYERFFMVLIEHFDGKFPLWLAPEQVRVLPISDDNLGYAHRVKNDLEEAGFRVTVEDRDQTIGRKIRAAHEDRLPYMLVVGDDEEAEDTVSVRDRKERESDPVGLEAFRAHLVAEREEKRTEPDFVD